MPGKYNWANETFCITGASSGLGRALSVAAAAKGATVIMIARNSEKLHRIKSEIDSGGGNAFAYPFNLKAVEKIPELCRRIVKDTKHFPSILVNNAGQQVMGFVQNTPIELYRESFELITLAPIALIQSLLPTMLQSDHGIIANVMSSINYRAFPAVSALCAAKSGLQAVHESLSTELAGTGVKTFLINPGGFRSNYWQNTNVEERLGDFKIPKASENAKEPSIVASHILTAMEKGKSKINLGTVKDHVGYHLQYWAPNLLNRILMDKNRELLSKRPQSMPIE